MRRNTMKKYFAHSMLLLFFLSSISPTQKESEDQFFSYDWAIVGAGFAGITALAVLLDCGVKPETIAWIDPEFNVGRVGKYYGNVPGNIQIQSILYYVNNCPYLNNVHSSALHALHAHKADEFPLLQVIVDLLQDFTHYLRDKVISIEHSVISLTRVDNDWLLEMPDRAINAKKVILAIGAQPKRLDYGLLEIPLDEALDKNKLVQKVCSEDCIAVFGSMHSAMLILKYLSECSVKKIINFYLHDYFYGAPGLEGDTALWVKNVLEKQPPVNLFRVKNTSENRKELLSSCTKAIYAIGYEQIKISINGSLEVTFDENTGIIDENVYGIGIAFPPTDFCNGQKIAKNGLNAYLAYAKKLIPHWINKDKACVTSIDTTEIPWI